MYTDWPKKPLAKMMFPTKGDVRFSVYCSLGFEGNNRSAS